MAKQSVFGITNRDDPVYPMEIQDAIRESVSHRPGKFPVQETPVQ